MASNARNVYAGEPLATGTLVVYPVGTEMPDSATSELPDGGIDLGHIGEDGFTETIDRNLEKIKNWGGKTVKVLSTEFTLTVKFVLLESLSAHVLRAVYGDNNVDVDSADSGTTMLIRKNARKLPRKTYCIDSFDSELEAYYRHWIPLGQITELGDVQTVHSDVIKFECTMECFPDQSDNNMYTLVDDGNPEGIVEEEVPDYVEP